LSGREKETALKYVAASVRCSFEPLTNLISPINYFHNCFVRLLQEASFGAFVPFDDIPQFNAGGLRIGKLLGAVAGVKANAYTNCPKM
jgi:hypothetical protein